MCMFWVRIEVGPVWWVFAQSLAGCLPISSCVLVIRSAGGYQSGASAPVFRQHILEPKERVSGNWKGRHETTTRSAETTFMLLLLWDFVMMVLYLVIYKLCFINWILSLLCVVGNMHMQVLGSPQLIAGDLRMYPLRVRDLCDWIYVTPTKWRERLD